MSEPPFHIDTDAVAPSNTLTGRPWLGIHFECCTVYTRIYRNKAGTAYQGHCPRCMRRINLRVGNDGTSARFFRAD